MSRRKKRIIEGLKIQAYAAEGKCVGYLDDGKVVFVSGVVPEDVVTVFLHKDKKSWAEGKLISIEQLSNQRVVPFCPHFGVCGGCKWQMLPYGLQLKFKQQQVLDQLKRIGHLDLPEIAPIMGSDLQRYYRNKLEFTFSATRYLTQEEIAAAQGETIPQEPALGFHAAGMFDKVVPIHTCYLQSEPTNILLKVLRAYADAHNLSFYDYRLQSGWLRNAVIRVARTGEVLINMVFQHELTNEREKLLQHILKEVPGITSLHYTINGKVNDSIADLDVATYFGKGYIMEKLENFQFKISPKSFFQTNSYQAERLYQVVRSFASLSGSETVYDLYCGTGSIGIFCSSAAHSVIGVETIEDAVLDARENARINGAEHCRFFVGDVATVCTDAFFAKHGRPDVIITDPPRAGMHEKLIEQLLRIAAPKIIYVSCNPATQARDLKMLSTGYRITRLQPVDMFPHTHHIENVALLELY